MKKALITLAALATIVTGLSLPSAASASEQAIQVHSSWNDHGRNNHHHDHRGWKKPGHKNRHQMMNPGEVRRMLHRQGYRTHDIRQQRGDYYVRAQNHKGRQVMLIVNARNGKIIGQRYIGRPHFNRT
ncbi:PepSY domain-containing protein [Brucellaceae bacterium C25G]